MKKRKIYNTLNLLMSLGLVFSLSSCNKKKEDEKEKSSLFIYLSGANLESEASQASIFIDELINSKANKNVDIYCLAGGSEKWSKEEFNKSFTTFFEIKEGNFKVLETSKMNMGDYKTLKYLTDYSKTIDSENKNLLFWGHGNKFELCHDHNYNYDALNFRELKKGLGDAKFETIYFNSCFSSNLDLLSYISTNANYALASEQTFPSRGYNTDLFLETLSSKNLSTLDKNKKIINDTKNKYKKTSYSKTLTLSCIDLKELNDKILDFFNFFNDLNLNYEESYKTFRKSNNIGSSSKDFYDALKDLNPELAKSFKKIVPYEIHSERFESNGIGIYYQEDNSNYDLPFYFDSAYFTPYYNLLANKKNYTNGKFLTIEPYVSRGDILISKKVKTNNFLGFVSFFLYDQNNKKLKEDVVGLSFDFDDTSTIVSLLNEGKTVFKFNNEILYDVNLYTVEMRDYTLKITYEAPIKLNNFSCNLKFSNTFEDTTELNLKIEGISYYDEETKEERLIELKSNDLIEINGKSFNFNNQKLTGEILDSAKVEFCFEDIYGSDYVSEIENI